MTRSERIFRVLLRAYPRRTQETFGDDMAQLFSDQLRDAPGGMGKASVWAGAIADIVLDAPRERLTGRSAVRVVEGRGTSVHRPLGPDLLAASAPLLLAGTLVIVAPGFLEPLLDDTVGLAGMPMGVAVTLLLALFAGLGITAMRRGGLRDGRKRLLAATVLAAPVPVLAFLAGLDIIVPYALVAGVLVVATSIRWLSFAIALPFALWLVFGPAFMLIVINLNSATP